MNQNVNISVMKENEEFKESKVILDILPFSTRLKRISPSFSQALVQDPSPKTKSKV